MGEFVIITIVSILQINGIIEDWKVLGWKALLNIIYCSKCSVFIALLITTNWFTASYMALIWFILIKIIDKYGMV